MRAIEQLFRAGLRAMANTPSVFGEHWFMGHTGAAIICGGLLTTQVHLPDGILALVQARAQALMDEHAALCDAPVVVAGSSTAPATVDDIVAELEQLTAELYNSGHGVIFAVLALMVLRRYPQLLEPGLVEGLLVLLRCTNEHDGHRYYGYDDYHRESIPYRDAIPAFVDAAEAAHYSLTEMKTAWADRQIGETVHFFAGDQIHGITHAHALLELERMGMVPLARTGLEQLRKQFFLNRQRDRDCEPYRARGQIDPRAREFWQRPFHNTHQIKLAYALLAVLEHLQMTDAGEVFSDMAKYWELLEL